MKLLTLNCHSWQEKNQQQKINYLAKVINSKDYDVIALQEVNQSINSKVAYKNIKEDNFALILKNELDKYEEGKYNFYWDFSHVAYDFYEEGVALLTKHKFSNVDSFFISKNDDINNWKTRKVVKSTIIYKERELDFYSCHLGWWNDEEESFKYQVDTLLSKMNSKNMSFLMGDFNNNAFIKGEGYDYLLSKNLKDLFLAFEGHDSGVTVSGEIDGWSENSEILRLDLILCNKCVKVTNAKVIFNMKNEDVISDHYGVEVEI